MKLNIFCLVIAFCLCYSTIQSQDGEFQVFDNGLIYSEETMDQLNFIVDSLNIKFKQCDLDRPYKSYWQTVGHFIEINSADVSNFKKDVAKNVDYQTLLNKYPNCIEEKNVLFLENKDKDGNIEIAKVNLEGNRNSSIEIDTKKYNRTNLHQNWIFEKKKNNTTIDAYYFPNPLEQIEIGHEWARMIQYVDCLIDTNASIYLEGADYGNMPELPKNYHKMSPDKKNKLLNEMRSTHVMGYCSQDSRPREHALNIAKLSAEAIEWEIFLQAHLNIMNDRFRRMSDGSYAWNRRLTYVKELEELEIEVYDLLIGTCLEAENAANGHYSSSIWRTGKALSETNTPEKLEAIFLRGIADEKLDDYNRLLVFYLFWNYYSYSKESERGIVIKEKLNKSIASLPSYMHTKIELKE